MPESKGRKAADTKAANKRKGEAKERQQRNQEKLAALDGSRAWVPPTFITLGLLGVLWLIVYYVASPYIGFMAALGGWNMLIGMGLIAASFLVATLWK